MPFTTLARRAAPVALAAVLAAASAIAQEQTGMMTATCNIQGTASPMKVQWTRYRDVVVWQDRHGLNSQTTDMQQYGPTYWEGMINTPYGQYRLTGQLQFIEAWKVGGVYSDMITLEVSQTGPQSFTMRDFYSDGPAFPCQVTGP
ncbi:MAG: hypothetical protein AAFQ22_01890 [Pseudomonadota bacterium]